MEHRCRIQSFANGGGWQRYFIGIAVVVSIFRSGWWSKSPMEAIAEVLSSVAPCGNLPLTWVFPRLCWDSFGDFIGETGIGGVSTRWHCNCPGAYRFSFPAPCWVKNPLAMPRRMDLTTPTPATTPWPNFPTTILHHRNTWVLGCKSTDDRKCTSRWTCPIPSPARNAACRVSSCGSASVTFPIVICHPRQAGHSLGGPPPIHLPGLQDNIQAPATGDGGRFRMTLRLHGTWRRESFNHPTTFGGGTDRPGRRRCATSSTPAPSSWGAGTASRRPHPGHWRAIPEQALPLHSDQHWGANPARPAGHRRQDVVTNYLMKLKDRQKVEIVSMDMEPYRAAVRLCCPRPVSWSISSVTGAHGQRCPERVRKGLRKELKPSQSRTLKGDRKILLKRAHEVSDQERLIMETWTGAFPQLLAAYEHKERFYGIWDATHGSRQKPPWTSG